MHTTNNHNEIAIPNLKRTNTLNKNNLIAKSTPHLDLIMEDPSQPVLTHVQYHSPPAAVMLSQYQITAQLIYKSKLYNGKCKHKY